MKEEVIVKTCDICKQAVEMFCYENPYDEHLEDESFNIKKKGEIPPCLS
jgi:hypothetical protein